MDASKNSYNSCLTWETKYIALFLLLTNKIYNYVVRFCITLCSSVVKKSYENNMADQNNKGAKRLFSIDVKPCISVPC